MPEIVRNLLRRRLRTGLTVFGITIGVFALTVMGAMSENYHTILGNGVRLAGSVIDVSPTDRDVEHRLHSGTLQRIRRISGVKAAVPAVVDTLGPPTQVSFAPPEVVAGVEPSYLSLFLPTLRLEAGRWLERGDDRHAVVGADLAERKGWKLGNTITWREEEFTIVGLLELTRAAPDWFVYLPLDRARKVLSDAERISAIRVLPEPGVNADDLAAQIQAEVPRVRAKSPTEAIADIRRSLAVFEALILSSAIIAGLVGGLAVTNTMIQSVHERTREIGIKKAVGASDLHIVAEYVAEAMVMSVIGGGLGLLLGYAATGYLNQWVAVPLGASELWLVTPRLMSIALAFSIGLGGLSGLYPAWRAARLQPVQALRTE